MIGCLFYYTSALERQIDEMARAGLKPAPTSKLRLWRGENQAEKGKHWAITDLP